MLPVLVFTGAAPLRVSTSSGKKSSPKVLRDRGGVSKKTWSKAGTLGLKTAKSLGFGNFSLKVGEFLAKIG